MDFSVDQSKGMLGTFAPQKEPYVYTLKEDTTPSGALARGVYSAKLKVFVSTVEFVNWMIRNFFHVVMTFTNYDSFCLLDSNEKVKILK